MPFCNRVDRGSKFAPARKSADFYKVIHYKKLIELLKGAKQMDVNTHTSHTQTTPETVYFKEFSSENSHAACAKPLATDKTLCK